MQKLSNIVAIDATDSKHPTVFCNLVQLAVRQMINSTVRTHLQLSSYTLENRCDLHLSDTSIFTMLFVHWRFILILLFNQVKVLKKNAIFSIYLLTIYVYLT